MEVLSNLRVKVSKKSNDAIKMIYHRKTNKHCAPAEALRVRQRKNMLKQYAKVKRKYGKIKNGFWRGGGKQVIVARSKLHSYQKREG
jgi:hypothetical protein